MAFTQDNTTGYSEAQLAALNDELSQRLVGVERGSDEWSQIEKAFADEVAGR